MVKIRLRRMGAKKRPFYRLVAADSRSPRNGRFIEVLGTYDPTQDPPTIVLKKERIEYWISNGAQPTDTARGILKSQGMLGAGTAEETNKKSAKTVKEETAEVAVEASVAEEVNEKKGRTRKTSKAEEEVSEVSGGELKEKPKAKKTAKEKEEVEEISAESAQEEPEQAE